MIDALLFCGDPPDPECEGANIIITDGAHEFETSPEKKYTCFQMVGPKPSGFCFNNLYLPDYEVSDEVLDAVIEHALTQKPKLILDASRTLEEVGRCDTRHGCSPVFYLHKLGLLSGSFVAGGVYLDRDDVDLMVQEHTSLILNPTADAGQGFGIPALRMYLDRGLKIFLGTGGTFFNPTKSILYEAECLRLLVNGVMCAEVITDADLHKILSNK